jgi:hypothetical protein
MEMSKDTFSDIHEHSFDTQEVKTITERTMKKGGNIFQVEGSLDLGISCIEKI